jgi:hypothetical protein
MNGADRRTLFFCFGPAKSGTTLLQRALNLHPEVSCPSEHDFTNLSAALENVFASYNNSLQIVDRRTGAQGATLLDNPTAIRIFKAAVRAIVEQAAGAKSIAGANDNRILLNLQAFDSMFDSPRMIAIFRNPIDSGMSAWHHNLRLAEEEHDASHREFVSRHGGLDGWLRHVTEDFVARVANWRHFVQDRDHVHTALYEDLVADRPRSLRGVFAFLGARTDDATIASIVAATDFESMRRRSAQPGFFRRGAVDMGAGEVTPELRRELLARAGEAMHWLGYRTP